MSGERAPRTDAELALHEDAITAAMAAHLSEHDRVALSYSGGAESGLLLHLFRPFRDRFVALWVNPGALPHEAEHVRRQAAGGPFVELLSDREAAWRQYGLPSLLPPSRLLGLPWDDAPPTGQRIAPNQICCAMVRSQPAHDWLGANAFTLHVHGQRRGEGTGLFSPLALRPYASWGPLAGWTRAEVMRRVGVHAVPLPAQYAEGAPETFECAICPANLAPARMAFLRKHYPAEHAETVRLAGEAFRVVSAAYEDQRRALEAASGD
ncbi:phosphoadenosine phosphosulfate reductase family protein [Neoroseomonas rubea]|uniref:phosphoadenosine phosphosulfate reductase domain-containing protein n=1 Tax=Neoroseomonas rubea TaxID=2748666 RepID=UPI001E542FD2|nr:phosphoadenosine phosphosulfate reductase family protein [Roseomonas rubea]